MYGLSSGYPPGFPGLPQTPPSTSATPPTTDTLGVAASQAASLNWWGMASQLATQDYLSRLGRDPAQFAALQAQLPGFEMAGRSKAKQREPGEVVVSSEGLRLPRVRNLFDSSLNTAREPDPVFSAGEHGSQTSHLQWNINITDNHC